MTRINSIRPRQIYNSHLEPTIEYVVHLTDGRQGRAASPHGETIGVYERQGERMEVSSVLEALQRDGLFDREIDQESFDACLTSNVQTLGKNTSYALSLALAYALRGSEEGSVATTARPHAPRLCLNILNGGRHAYTNAVLSNYHEYILVARTSEVRDVLAMHADIQATVRAALAQQPKAIVNGNPVSTFDSTDDRECIEFLLGVCDRLGFSDDFDLMIDAAAAGLKQTDGYRLAVTSGEEFSSDEFCDYWLSMASTYPLRFLEDPFGELDREAWVRLATSQATCQIIGDDFYCSDANRIREGAASGCTQGVIIKPNQAGTVTAVGAAIEAAYEASQTVIVSHRSVSTESPFEATLACDHAAPYIKIGPLLTDYSSIVRLNEIIRIAEG